MNMDSFEKKVYRSASQRMGIGCYVSLMTAAIQYQLLFGSRLHSDSSATRWRVSFFLFFFAICYTFIENFVATRIALSLWDKNDHEKAM